MTKRLMVSRIESVLMIVAMLVALVGWLWVLNQMNEIYGKDGIMETYQSEKVAAYDKARDYVRNNQYAEALRLLMDIGDYENAKEYREICLNQLEFTQYVYYSGKDL